MAKVGGITWEEIAPGAMPRGCKTVPGSTLDMEEVLATWLSPLEKVHKATTLSTLHLGRTQKSFDTMPCDMIVCRDSDSISLTIGVVH